MTTSNRSILQKADLIVDDIIANGGYLEAAQAQRFIQTAIDQAVLMPMSTVVPMRSHTHHIDKTRFGSRILRAGTEGQALSVNERAKPDLEREVLNAQLFKAEVRLTNEDLEDQIERGNFEDTVVSTMGARVALDMDEVIAQGDTTSLDPFLAKFDGIIKQASVNVVSNGSNPISKSTFKSMLRAMPSEFLRNKRQMRFLVSVDTEIEYRDTLAGRETALGDAFLERDVPVQYGGVPIVDVPVFPENLGGGMNETIAILTDPKNIHTGIWRRVKVEKDKDISAGVLIIVVTVRFDVQFEEPKATSKAEDILLGT